MISTILIPILILISEITTFGQSSYIWSPTEEWTPCSKPCDEGVETQEFICLKKTSYRTNEFTDLAKCSIQKKPIKTRTCSFGKCSQTPSGSFVWQVGNWSVCPKTCGGSGLQHRDVNCFLMTAKGEFLLSKLSKCDYRLEPKRFIPCALADCSPKFLTSKWEKCPETSDCRQTIRRREVRCMSLLRTGKLEVKSPGVCYRMRQKPPSSWMYCSVDHRCLKARKAIKKLNEEVKIKNDLSEIFQMKQTKRLKVYVGQTAHVFIFTRLSIFCPVPKSHRNKIIWEHGKRRLEYKGISQDRVKVNRNGVLTIREFHLTDIGVWRCRVGRFTADAVLRLEQPSNGFNNWLKRHANNNYGMLNEESTMSIIRPESVLWMKSEWSQCSKTCESNKDNPGYQTRKVTCERIEAQYYKIIEDKYCPPLKPISSKKCKLMDHCPIWKVQTHENDQCSDECVDIGLSKTTANITCEFNNKTVDSSFCDREKVPNVTCLNSKCQISYLYGLWSQCSLSCSNITDTSIRSRTMKCVWKYTNKSAYHLCQQHQLSYLPLTKPCRVPKCILGCKDLTPACVRQSKYRCRNSLFYHFCCAFCRKQFS